MRPQARRNAMPFDPREFSESLRLETVITSAEIELENSLVYALHGKAQEFDDARVRDQLRQYLPKSADVQNKPAWERPISIPNSPQGADIDHDISRARGSWSVFWFIERLAPGGEMDYKHGPGNRIYEDFGNFNYGAVALGFGLSEEVALRAAGLVQVLVNSYNMMTKRNAEDTGSYVKSHGLDFVGEAPYGDQTKDQEMIKQGFRYYREVYLKEKIQNETQKTLPEKVVMRRDLILEEMDSFLRSPRRIGSIFLGE
jgi:hypothetical protein